MPAAGFLSGFHTVAGPAQNLEVFDPVVVAVVVDVVDVVPVAAAVLARVEVASKDDVAEVAPWPRPGIEPAPFLAVGSPAWVRTTGRSLIKRLLYR